MHRVRKLTARIREGERGANAVLIALLMVPMMGFAAIAVDIGAQHAERAQLQQGADAAALAAAKMCAEDEAACTTGTVEATGNSLIEQNFGTPVGGTAEVPPGDLNLAENWVRVSAAAEFPHFFASLFDSDDDPSHSSVRASAIAEWGTPDEGSTIPLAVAECELSKHFDPGTETTGDPFILLLIGPGSSPKKPAECAPGYPGGFGWLEGDDVNGDGTPDCEVIVEVDVPEAGVPGSSDTKAGGCPDDYLAKLLGKTILIPLYDSYTAGSGGSKGSYMISRFAAFYVTGFHVASGKCEAPGVKTGSDCYLPGESKSPGFKGGEFGLQGYFVRYVAIGEDFDLGDGSPDGGLTVARLIG
ncbi:pilus assembly protein TadG-related protein [Agromyces sp. NPDC056523]|uniref:pilus assembly protein TadG-related protein n=1 Tax=Agromyces sp. NPDC056523 TaxID=3345850 RepID=UPI0036735189